MARGPSMDIRVECGHCTQSSGGGAAVTDGSGEEVIHLWRIRHEGSSGSAPGNSQVVEAHWSGGATVKRLEAAARWRFTMTSSFGGLHRRRWGPAAHRGEEM
jgi:hypothetical protein